MPSASRSTAGRTLDRPARSRPRRSAKRRRAQDGRNVWLWHGVEVGALVTVALIGVIVVLGALAPRLVGAGFWSHLLPFAGTVLVLGLLAAMLLRAWLVARRWLAERHPRLPVVIAGLAAMGMLVVATRPSFHGDVASVRRLVGGPAEAHRLTLAHQVFAAYRRTDLRSMAKMWDRARVYEPIVQEAAAAYDVDPEVLMGVASAESSFNPRDSADGGRGLFQITAPPTSAMADVRTRLGVDAIDLTNQRHNAFVAAATLKLYFVQMAGDPFLGLLAYNIGPRNGGLRSIMGQYGARDFVTVQPYLQNLPRDYPIRVLSAALSYRLWRTEGRLPRYEDGDNALRIQRTGIPMLTAGAS
jgi:hypothetical protein